MLAAASASLSQVHHWKARTAFLEFLCPIIVNDGAEGADDDDADDPRFASDKRRFDDLVLKLASFLKDSSAEAKKPKATDAAAAFAAASRCAEALRRADPGAFADRIASTAPEHRRAMVAALNDPDFDDQLKHARSMALAQRTSTFTPVEEDDDDDLPEVPPRDDDDDDEDEGPPPTTTRRHQDDSSLAQAVTALAAEASLSRRDDEVLVAATEARELIHSLAKTRAEDPAWHQYFDQAAMLLVERGCAGLATAKTDEEDVLASFFAKAPAPTVPLWELAARHESLGVLCSLGKAMPRKFRAILDTAAPRLLQVASLENLPLELAFAAERVLHVAMKHVDPDAVFQTLLKSLQQRSPRSPAAEVPIARLIATSAKYLPTATLHDSLDTVLPALARSATASHAPVRKAAFEALAALSLALRDVLQPHLRFHLNDDHLNLIAFYVHKHHGTSSANDWGGPLSGSGPRRDVSPPPAPGPVQSSFYETFVSA